MVARTTRAPAGALPRAMTGSSMFDDEDRRLRRVIGREIGDILWRQRPGKPGHDRILARTRLVVAQRLAEIVRMLTAKLGIVRRRAVAVEPMTRLADFLRLRFSPLPVGGACCSGRA